MNKVLGTGRMTRDAQMFRKQEGNEETVTAKCTVASERPYRRDTEQQADFIPLTAFGKKAEFIERNIKKGQRIEYVGRLQSGSYKKDGETIYTLEVIIEDIRPIDFKKEESEEEGTHGEGFLEE